MGPKTQPEKRRHLRDGSAIHEVAKPAAAGGGFGAPFLPQCLVQNILIGSALAPCLLALLLGADGLLRAEVPECTTLRTAPAERPIAAPPVFRLRHARELHGRRSRFEPGLELGNQRRRANRRSSKIARSHPQSEFVFFSHACCAGELGRSQGRMLRIPKGVQLIEVGLEEPAPQALQHVVHAGVVFERKPTALRRLQPSSPSPQVAIREEPDAQRGVQACFR